MTIEEIKRALVEVKELCVNIKCSDCPLHKEDDYYDPYCPLIEDEDGLSIHQPAYWVIDDWEEDGDESH